MNVKLIKLAKLVMTFKSVTTDKQTLIYNDDLEVGVEVFIEDDSTGEILPAPNGDYTTEDMVITVADGVITEVKPVEEPEEPATEVEPEDPAKEPDENEFAEPEDPAKEEPEVDEKQAIIDELTAAIAEKDAQIADLQVKIEELTAELQKANEPVVEPVKMNKVAPSNQTNDKNPALKYFQK